MELPPKKCLSPGRTSSCEIVALSTFSEDNLMIELLENDRSDEIGWRSPLDGDAALGIPVGVSHGILRETNKEKGNGKVTKVPC